MIKTQQISIIKLFDWDTLVETTYGKKYSFQQQDGCKDKGKEYITVPVEDPEDYENDTIPEIVNGEEMGVSFKAWLKRDPKQELSDEKDASSWSVDLWWERNFYPHVDMIINDLHEKGLLPAGDYMMDIDW